MATVTEEVEARNSPNEPWQRDLRLVRTQRVLQIILGLFWLLDAGLQFQPYMFGSGFTTTYLLNNAHSQPDVVRWVITNVGNFVGPHVAVWNTFFALIQVAIGMGLLFRRTVRPALVVSFFWVFAVWFFGEGLGQLLTGFASALTGAPGSVFLYGLIGLMAWPRAARGERQAHAETSAGMASSAAGQGIGGAATPLLAWCGYWSLAAVLFLLPNNRTPTSVSSAIVGMSPGEPSAYSHFLNSFGGHFGSGGIGTTWLLAIGSVVVGFGPLLFRRPTLFLAAGGLLAAFFWVTGQGLGGIFTGSGTDPNSGPLIVLLALAMVPAALPDPATWRSPFSNALSRYPVFVLGGLVVLVVSLFLSAAYPAPAQETSGMAMSGMTGMAGSETSGSNDQTAATATCTKGNNGSTRAGLDVTNTPNMSMGGPGAIMNMNGADASAAAGLNTVKANWHYTGPALPTAEAQELLAKGANGPTDIHMAANGCASEPTFSQQINATQYVQNTTEAAARYPTPSAAAAAGYVLASPADYPVTYYVNPSIVDANTAARKTLDPSSIDGLVYAQTPAGTDVLAAAMYLKPSSVTRAPMPYGSLVQWHQRTNTCGLSTSSIAVAFQITGTAPCAQGTAEKATPYMTMVWQVPVAGGPLAIQPPDIQIVEAATKQTSS